MSVVSVALPVRDAGPRLATVLDAVRAQGIDREVEIVVVDCSSSDGSAERARAAGARVEVIPPAAFSHGGTRNRLMELASGEHVVFLTQDAVPADGGWLARLLRGFELAPDVGLVCGPYVPRDGASPMVRRELAEWFARLAPDGRPTLQRGPVAGAGVATFFTSANGAVARRAWEQVPFRRVPYAEDQRLAVDMLRAGWARAFVPAAAVVHSHEYPPLDRLRRTFDEFRALREVHGHVASVRPRLVLGGIRREVAADRAFVRQEGADERAVEAVTVASLGYHAVRALGAGLGTRADRLPPGLRRRLSLERRATFEPTHQA